MPLAHAFQETYLSVEALINMICKGFTNSKFPFHILKSEANLAFIHAYHSYTVEKGAFTTWVYWKVECALKSFIREELIRKKRKFFYDGRNISVEDYEVEDYRKGHLSHDLEFLPLLSEDARNVVMLVFESPARLSNLVKKQGKWTPFNLKIAIREHLINNLGWGSQKIRETFNEIKEILK